MKNLIHLVCVLGSISIVSGDVLTSAEGANIGDGNSIPANGNSTAIGEYNDVSGADALAVGYNNDVQSSSGIAMGNNNQVNGVSSFALGTDNTISLHYSGALGKNNSVSGYYSYAFGNNATVTGLSSIGIGLNYTSPFTVSSNNVMAIMGGKVGIGKTNPAVPLEVSGLSYFFNDTGEDMRVGRNANEHLSIEVNDNHLYFDYEQDEDGNGSHSMMFRNQASGTGNNDIRFYTSGTARLTIHDNGNVGLGIGTTAPVALLDMGVCKINTWTMIGDDIVLGNFSGTVNGMTSTTTAGGDIKLYDNEGNLTVDLDGDAGNVVVGSNICVGRSTPVSGYQVSVDGKIVCEELKVEAVSGADFVFEKDYDLMPLDVLEKHVTEKKHLPEIDPAKVMEEEGVSVSEMQIKLLQKIEELTLYIIDQNKRIKDLEAQLN